MLAAAFTAALAVGASAGLGGTLDGQGDVAWGSAALNSGPNDVAWGIHHGKAA
ncbi:hypothetical protein [Streptomyces sp. NPDC051561]|uniref:hypothetical protein n=1 Tax=Streptomyces sp. NPDC051561 TaxID=3365658 RepID=UPI003797D4EA